MKSRVGLLHMNAHRESFLFPFSENLLEQRRTKPLAAKLGQQSNIYDPDFVLGSVDVESANQLFIQENDLKIAITELRFVLLVLRQHVASEQEGEILSQVFDRLKEYFMWPNFFGLLGGQTSS